jgi:ubiquinone/menaquinone biosynthesis C-methylase UbiE
LSVELAHEVDDEGWVVGVDPDKQRLHIARKRILTSKKAVTFIEGWVYDAVNVKWGPFDGVLANFVLHWVPRDNVQLTLHGIYECLKPGGRFVAYISANMGKLNEDLVPMATGRDEESLLNLCLRPLPFWRQHCTDTGFKVESCS